MGYSEFHPTWQMKHGINTEVHAKAKYKTLFKNSHLKFLFKDPGTTVTGSHPFISTSPDLESQRQCHGPRLVEIKCPVSIIGEVPSPQNYGHIEMVDGTLNLKRCNPYFSQVQGQMQLCQLSRIERESPAFGFLSRIYYKMKILPHFVSFSRWSLLSPAS